MLTDKQRAALANLVVVRNYSPRQHYWLPAWMGRALVKKGLASTKPSLSLYRITESGRRALTTGEARAPNTSSNPE